MAHARAVRAAARRTRRRSRPLVSGARLIRLGRRAQIAFAAAPFVVRMLAGTLVVVVVWLALNWLYQVVRKPTELFFPVSGALGKAPAETWRHYAPLFRRHATVVIKPELLAALAKVEAAGTPVAR